MHRLTTLLNALALASPAWAGGGLDMLYFYGHGETENDVALLEAAVTEQGSTGFTSSAVWPSSLDPYALVIAALPTEPFSAYEVGQIEALMDAEGTFVLVVDAADYVGDTISIANTLLQDLGADARFQANSIDSECQMTEEVDEGHVLTTGVDFLEFAWSADLVPAGAEVIVEGPSGQALVAVEQRIVLVTDLDLLVDDNCDSVTDSYEFMGNLFAYILPVDEDEDEPEEPDPPEETDDDDAADDDDDGESDDDDATADDDDSEAEPEEDEGPDDDDPRDSGESSRRAGCSAVGGSGGVLGLALLVVGRRRG